MRQKIVIMGAGGRDFHVFNSCYRYRPEIEVVAFTATQIPHIENRIYPPSLSGPGYPQGIPILPEERLEEIVDEHAVERVVFAYSDVSLETVAQERRRVELVGASFETFDVDATMLESKRPVIAVCAVRTGCGKSQTARRIVSLLREIGLRPVVVRHPMPYGDLSRQRVQRFARLEDLAAQKCTIEEMEEYEPHIVRGAVVYAGADYAAILAAAEQEADVVIWDGGNNDTPFFRPDLWITVADPHRPGHELSYFPGLVNFERADLILLNKVDTAPADGIATVEENARHHNPRAVLVRAASPPRVADPAAVRGRRVLVIEDGPTLTHGGMKYGAGVIAARACGAAELVDPRPWAVGEIRDTFDRYPEIGTLLPAMGYGEHQIHDLEATVNAVDCDLVLVATPMDLGRVISIARPSMRVTYELEEEGDELRRRVQAVAQRRLTTQPAARA